MGWMESLVSVYDTCMGNPEYIDGENPLIPICHISVQVQIEVTIDIHGGFVRAEAIPKDLQTTVIPCTESSAGRSGFSISAYPLVDKLQYLIEDYSDHVLTGKDSKNKRAPKSGYGDYMEQLDDWCSSDFSNAKVCAIRDYVGSGSLFRDLERSGVIVLDDDGRFKSKSNAPEAMLFSISKIKEQENAFVRWRVEDPESLEKETWNDHDIQKSWIGYYLSKQADIGFCYVTGKEVPLAKNHPSKIYKTASRAKLISSNDKSGFVFRGRFEDSDQACGIGYESTQKAHNALRWLISRQGCIEDSLCVVSWTDAVDAVPNPVDGMEDFLEVEDAYITGVQAARNLNSRIRGYNSKLITEKVMVMGLDSATTGRISILMYRELSGSEFLDRIEAWHESCAWIHTYYTKKSEEGKPIRLTFVGAPSPKDMSLAAYGFKADSKAVSMTIKRILPSIMDGTSIPRDIVDSAVRRASKPLSMEDWQWRKTLSIACSMFKNNKKGEYDMVLEKERCTRDYLFGRLLAVADAMERSALRESGESRQTTAIRMMQRFSEFPCSTWKTIELSLVPYRSRLGMKAAYYDRMMSEITDKFETSDFIDDHKLSGEFLLGYHCQINEIYRKKEDHQEEREE